MNTACVVLLEGANEKQSYCQCQIISLFGRPYDSLCILMSVILRACVTVLDCVFMNVYVP